MSKSFKQVLEIDVCVVSIAQTVKLTSCESHLLEFVIRSRQDNQS